MIRLELKRDDHWLDLGFGVRVHVRPCSAALVMAARSAAGRELGTTGEPAAGPDAIVGMRTVTFLKALARLAIKAWEGVGDANGNAAAVTPEGIDALMDLWPMADAFERLYLGPALLLDDEKNA
jgi:hypothetical protein